MLKMIWRQKVNLIGEKVVDPLIHSCDKCRLPILIYGRMIPCKHVFCLNCARCMGKKCMRCSYPVVRVEESALGTVFICTFGGGKHDDEGCRRTYLSQRDLQAHVNHRHNMRRPESKPPKQVSATQQKVVTQAMPSQPQLDFSKPPPSLQQQQISQKHEQGQYHPQSQDVFMHHQHQQPHPGHQVASNQQQHPGHQSHQALPTNLHQHMSGQQLPGHQSSAVQQLPGHQSSAVQQLPGHPVAPNQQHPGHPVSMQTSQQHPGHQLPAAQAHPGLGVPAPGHPGHQAAAVANRPGAINAGRTNLITVHVHDEGGYQQQQQVPAGYPVVSYAPQVHPTHYPPPQVSHGQPQIQGPPPPVFSSAPPYSVPPPPLPGMQQQQSQQILQRTGQQPPTGSPGNLHMGPPQRYPSPHRNYDDSPRFAGPGGQQHSQQHSPRAPWSTSAPTRGPPPTGPPPSAGPPPSRQDYQQYY